MTDFINDECAVTDHSVLGPVSCMHPTVLRMNKW